MESNDKKTTDYSINLETKQEEKISFKQKILQKLASNRWLSKLPFANKLVYPELNFLPEGRRRKNNK